MILEGFAAQSDVAAKLIWIGAPDWVSALAIFEDIEELDEDFELTSDIREACRMSIAQPIPFIQPGDSILVGKSPDRPEMMWEVVAGSRRNNPISPITSWIVQKVALPTLKPSKEEDTNTP